jgi:SprT protein
MRIDDTALEQQALAYTRHLISLAADHFAVHIPQFQVRFDLRGKAAGMARFHPQGDWIIRYNQAMLAENGQAFIDQTVPHEVAHLVARAVHGAGIRPHGAEWQSIMTLFGAKPVRCHNFNLSRKHRRSMRYFPYRCACGDHQLSAIRHHRCLSGVTYLCRRCGSPLSPKLTVES